MASGSDKSFLYIGLTHPQSRHALGELLCLVWIHWNISPYFSFCSKIPPMRFGLALPLLSFITWPLRKFSAATLPAL